MNIPKMRIPKLDSEKIATSKKQSILESKFSNKEATKKYLEHSKQIKLGD